MYNRRCIFGSPLGARYWKRAAPFFCESDRPLSRADELEIICAERFSTLKDVIGKCAFYAFPITLSRNLHSLLKGDGFL